VSHFRWWHEYNRPNRCAKAQDQSLSEANISLAITSNASAKQLELTRVVFGYPVKRRKQELG
jgi:hypothetical protein